MSAKRILVTGGSGRLGRALVAMLLDAGHRVRVLTRRQRERTAHDWATGDLSTGAGLAGATAGADVIVHLATTNGRGDVPATGRLIESAAAAGTPHLVYLSIVGIDQASLGYYRAKLACERLVERSGMPWTIVRSTQFHDLITDMCDVQRLLPATVMPAGVSFQPIDVTEVAGRLVTIAGNSAVHRVADLGGPEVRDAAELARTYLRSIGRHRPAWRVPLPGKAIRDYRTGIHLAPDKATGQITFEDFLARRRGTLMRAGVGFLAVTQLVVGVWALFFPAGFFALPVVGMGMAYNEHLMRDYGAMALASAVVLAAAVVHMGPSLVRAALVMYLMFAVPHFVVHLTMLDHLAPSTGALLMTALAIAIALPAALLVLALRSTGTGATGRGYQA